MSVIISVRLRKLCRLAALLALAVVSFGVERAAAQDAPREPVDIVLVIDNSGSMWPGPENNDPEGLRYAAARLLVDLAGEGDRVAVVQFGSDAQVIGGQLPCRVTSPAAIANVDPAGCPLVEVNDANRQSIIDTIQLPAGNNGHTCMHLGLGLAQRLLDAGRSADRPQAILFLTDGNFYCLEDNADADRDRALDRLGESDVVVYSVILGEGVDDTVPNALADRTGGRVDTAADANDLALTFSQFYAALQPSRYAVALEPQSGAPELSLVTNPDQRVTEINFVVAYGAAQSLSRGEEVFHEGIQPDGTEYAVRVDRNEAGDPKYEIHTLRGNPLTGPWRLRLAAGATRGLAIVDAHVAPTLLFPRAEQLFAARHVSQRDDGYLIWPAAVADGQELTGIDIDAPGETVDNGPDNFFRLPRSAGPREITVRVGAQVDPLILQRAFEIRPGEPGEFPRLEVVEIVAGAEALPTRFVVRWSADAASVLADTRVEAVVVDGAGSVIYHRDDFTCEDNVCVHEGDVGQEPGHRYDVWFLASATLPDGALFSDYAHDQLTTEPQLQVRNLPETIDLIQDAGPFPVEVIVQSETDPGSIAVELADSTGATAAIRPRLELESGLTPGAVVHGQLIFDDLAALSVGGFNGELRLTNDNVAVVPQSRAVVYRPRVELSLDDATIDLTEGLGPFDLSATLVGRGAPTEITARVIDPASGAASPISARLSLPQLAPGRPTDGTLSFYVPPDLPAAPYSGQVVFTALDGTSVTPGTIDVELLLARADVRIIADSQLNFGYWLNPDEPIELPLEVEFANRPVNLSAELVAVTPTVPLSATLRVADARAAGSGPRPAVLSLALTAAGERLPKGDVNGRVRLAVADAIGGTTTPAEIPFRLNRPGYLTVFLWCDPNHRVDFLPSAEQVACWFWPRRTLIDETPITPRWYWLSIIRSMVTFSVLGLAFVAIRVRHKNRRRSYVPPPPPPPAPSPPPPTRRPRPGSGAPARPAGSQPSPRATPPVRAGSRPRPTGSTPRPSGGSSQPSPRPTGSAPRPSGGSTQPSQRPRPSSGR